MDTREEVAAERGPAPSRRGPVLAFAAIAAAALIGTAVLLATDAVEPMPQADRPPIEIAEEFVEAVANWDVEKTSTLLASDAAVFSPPARSAGDWAAYLRWKEAAGLSFTSEGCVLEASGEPAVVACSIRAESVWADALAIEVSDQGRFGVTVLDGRVTIVTESGENSSDPTSMAQVWNRFHDWVMTNHPEALAVMHSDDGRTDPVLETVVLTDESIQQWETMTEQFVAEFEG